MCARLGGLRPRRSLCPHPEATATCPAACALADHDRRRAAPEPAGSRALAATAEVYPFGAGIWLSGRNELVTVGVAEADPLEPGRREGRSLRAVMRRYSADFRLVAAASVHELDGNWVGALYWYEKWAERTPGRQAAYEPRGVLMLSAYNRFEMSGVSRAMGLERFDNGRELVESLLRFWPTDGQLTVGRSRLLATRWDKEMRKPGTGARLVNIDAGRLTITDGPTLPKDIGQWWAAVDGRR